MLLLLVSTGLWDHAGACRILLPARFMNVHLQQDLDD